MTTSCDDQFSCIHRNVSGLSEISYFWGCFRAHGAADFLKYVHIVNVQQRQDLRRNTTLSYTWRRDDRRQRLAIIEETPEKARQSTSTHNPLWFALSVQCIHSEVLRSQRDRQIKRRRRRRCTTPILSYGVGHDVYAIRPQHIVLTTHFFDFASTSPL